MPPKIKVTKEEILTAAMELVRKNGAQALNARTVAAALDCSTQPVFSNFATMEELRLAVVEKADALCGEYIRREIENNRYPTYKASGMAYIRFAKEEKELFRLLYMRDRTGETFPQPMELADQMESLVQNNTGLNKEESKLFHLEMWAFVHGIAVLLATDFVPLEEELISRMLSDAYLGLRKHYETEES